MRRHLFGGSTLPHVVLFLGILGGRWPPDPSPGPARPAPSVPTSAEISFIKQDWDQASRAYEAMVRAEPGNGRAWYRLGLSSYQLKQYERAAAAIERAVESRFVGQNVYYNLAVVHARLGSRERALDDLGRAVAVGYDQPRQLEQDPDLALVRNDPRLRSLAEKAEKNARLVIGEPVWSPDGSEILYSSNENGRQRIFVVRADGTRKRMVATGDFAYAGMASWSPDGARIAFSAGAPFDSEGGTRDVYVMSSDGSHLLRLTNGPGNNHYPRFSPDGRKIVFNSDRDGHREIYVANADGSAQTRVTRTDAHSDYACWSPDGRKIIFESQRDGSWETFTMNADGSNPTRLTAVGSDTSAPRVSPDGAKIAFHSTRNGSFDVYVMNSDGTLPIRLTSLPGFDGLPEWSPDGQRIAFVSNRTGRREVYTMTPQGSGVVCVTCGGSR